MAFIEHNPSGTWRGSPFVRGRRYRVLQQAPSHVGHLDVGEVLEYFGAYAGIYDGVSIYAFTDDRGRERTWLLGDGEALEKWSKIFVAESRVEQRLQPLRVPTGWAVVYNDLHDIDPADVAEDERYAFLKEDLLQMAHERFGRVLDVGWHPAGDLANGAYRLALYAGDCAGKLLFDFRTADRARLVTEVERLLREVCDGRL